VNLEINNKKCQIFMKLVQKIEKITTRIWWWLIKSSNSKITNNLMIMYKSIDLVQKFQLIKTHLYKIMLHFMQVIMHFKDSQLLIHNNLLLTNNLTNFKHSTINWNKISYNKNPKLKEILMISYSVKLAHQFQDHLWLDKITPKTNNMQ
jgi:hypothetical protein